MSPAGKKRATAAAALVIAGGALAFISFGGIGENLVYFWNVDELLAQGPKAYGATVRLGGMVQEGSYSWNPETLDLKFDVGMSPKAFSNHVTVKAEGAPPQMFREGIGVVVEGGYDGTVFTAKRVIVKHSNEYQPPAPGERPQDMYKTLVTPDS